MPEVVWIVLLVAGCAIALAALALLARRIRRRGAAGPAIGAAMAAYDEAMHTTAHTAFTEADAQRERTHEIHRAE